MQQSIQYLRIGTSYYKLVEKPLVSGDSIRMLVPWSVECIRQDHGKDFLARIPRYDGFCLIPEHIHFRQKVGNFYNRYHPFRHEPQPGYPKLCLAFLNHVFGEQLEFGLDYLKILLLQPLQKLPILCLVSEERNTGKTTFLNFLKQIFGDNMTLNSNEDFRSSFNAEWAQKLIIGVDETFLDKKEDSERLKNLSTSKYYKVEAKGVDRQEIEFFGKFILCSNNEESFVFIDKSEIRYWIRKLPPLQQENKNLLGELLHEIPFLIHYLIQRPYATQPGSRMWFTPKQIFTSALEKAKRYNRNRLEVEMAGLLLWMMDNKDINEIDFCLSDMQDWLHKKGIRVQDSHQVRRILQEEWQLKPTDNAFNYQQYRLGSDGSIYEFKAKGRIYHLDKTIVLSLNNPVDFVDG